MRIETGAPVPKHGVVDSEFNTCATVPKPYKTQNGEAFARCHSNTLMRSSVTFSKHETAQTQPSRGRAASVLMPAKPVATVRRCNVSCVNSKPWLSFFAMAQKTDNNNKNFLDMSGRRGD